MSDPSSIPQSGTRYLSIDVLRGLTIAFMIIVNSPGDAAASYGQLEHAVWNGFTLTDLVFPTFLFVVGNAMSFTMTRYRMEDRRLFLIKVFKRTLIIYLIGIFLNAYPFFHMNDEGHYAWIDFTTIRMVGVLGRIAICYSVVSVVIYFTSSRTAYILSAVILGGYWWILFHFGDQPDPYSLVGNAVSKFDLLTLGTNHIWHGEGVPFDPEGLLSTLPAIANVTAGFFAGKYIQEKGANWPTVIELVITGCMLTGLAFTWDLVFPINKKIWTSSYVLLTVGLDLVILSMLLALIEIVKFKKWKFFVVFGKNPLILYVLSYLIVKLLYYIKVDDGNLKDWIFKTIFLPLASDANASLLFSLFIMLLVWLMGYFLYKRKIYIKV